MEQYPLINNDIVTEGLDNKPGLVSVIIPTYNHAGFIRDAINSVLAQTYAPFEIIVVDDGSQDDTRSVVSTFGAQVNYIWQENRGLSAARNTGIRVAKGEYIGVLDADDMYEPEFLARMVTRLETDPQAAGSYCGFLFVDARGKALFQTGRRVVAPEKFHAALVEGNFLVPECILVRADYYRRVGPFDEALRACEDWDMWLRISRSNKVIGTGEILIRHRVLAGSMSSDPQRMLNNRLAVLGKLFDDSPAPACQHAYGQAYLATSYEYLQYGDTLQAYHCLQKACEYFPGLLAEFEVFYELGCGSQPKGSRGDFVTLDFPHNADRLLSFLDQLFENPILRPALNPYRRKAYANACLALGNLAYGAHQYELARRYLLRAFFFKPAYLFKKHLSLTLLKSLPGLSSLSRLRRSPQRSEQ